MRDLESDLRSRGGLARRSDLVTLGHSRHRLARAVATQLVTVPRRGWIASRSAPTEAIRAVACGGKLGGASALQLRGIWVDDPGALVISCAPTASRLPPVCEGERRIYVAERFPEESSRTWLVSTRDAILQHSLAASVSEMVAVIDSALHRGLLRSGQLRSLLSTLPERARPRSFDLDGASMSGTESHLRFALRGKGYRVITQASISRVGQVDLLVDGWFIVECDSSAFHGDVTHQTTDRRRDGNAALSRYATARFTYGQVMFELEWCLAVVEAGLLRGRPAASFDMTTVSKLANWSC